MKSYKSMILILLIAQFVFELSAQTKIPVYQDNKKSTEERVNDICRLMTLDEKAGFLSGADDWHFKGIKRLGIPPLQVTDCGHGITIVFDKEGNWVGNASCFPTAVGQAATWNRDLIRQVGGALAREARATGSSLLLAPMVNIKRHPLNGRNYELFSEDPLLTGEMASAFITGCQEEQIGAVIKAFAANNQQANQESLVVRMDERTLREIYLPGFGIAIAKAKPWGLMTAYNGLNGVRTSASKHLLQEILKKSWNFQGFVVSDWRAVKGVESITSGVDIEMPGPGKFMTKENVLTALAEKKLSSDELDDMVRRLLRSYVKSKLLDASKPALSAEINTKKHQLLARRVSEEGIVLLKNSKKLLPLEASKIKKLAVIGPNSSTARLGGGGSASVSSFYSVSPLDGLRKFCGASTEIIFEEGCGLDGTLKVVDGKYLRHVQNGGMKSGFKAEYYTNSMMKGEPKLISTDELVNFSWGWANPRPEISRNGYSVRWSGQLLPPKTGEYKLGISAGECGYRLFLNGKLEIDQWETGGRDNFESHFTTSNRQISIRLEEDKAVEVSIEFYKRMNRNFIRFEWEIPGNNSMDLAINAAQECDAAVVFVGLSNYFEGGNNDRKDILLPGEQSRLISEVAKANPNTVVVLINGSAIGMPWINEVHALLEAYYPGEEGGNAIANVLFGKVNPSGKLPETFPVKVSDNPAYGNYPGTNNEVNYAEGIYVGYRHYDTRDIGPLFPFGYGLSYTTFEYTDLQLIKEGSRFLASFSVRNTGRMDGAEVAQLYIHDPVSSEDRPVKELKNFEKIFLRAGEKKRVTLDIKDEDLSFFSSTHTRWVLEPGEFELQIGSSSRDIRLRKTFTK